MRNIFEKLFEDLGKSPRELMESLGASQEPRSDVKRMIKTSVPRNYPRALKQALKALDDSSMSGNNKAMVKAHLRRLEDAHYDVPVKGSWKESDYLLND